jgi:ABC-type phosphate/phosphonate transport system substrate-binding protein
VNRLIASLLLVGLAQSVPVGAEEKKVVRIGIPRSIFRDVPPALIAFANQPFKDLVKTQTGFDGDVVNDPEAMNIARDLDAKKLQLGVLLGHEYAWAKQKYPELEALVVAVPKPKEVQAFILVRHDMKAGNLGEMKGTKLVLATGTRDHAKLFLEKRQTDEMAAGGFCSTQKTATVHDAIFKVIEGEADATVADHASWLYFKKLYPGQAENVRVLLTSEVFPATVIAYRKGALTDDEVTKCREGMLTAHKNPKGGRLMTTIKMEKFDVMPANYDESLKAILKSYPLNPITRVAAE